MQPMMAIFTPLRWAGGGFDAGGGFLEVEQGAAAAWAGDIVGFKNADACGLEDVVGDAEGLAGGCFSLDENRVADAIAEQGADVGGGVQEIVDEIGGSGWCEGVLEQDRVFGIELRGQEAIGSDDR